MSVMQHPDCLLVDIYEHNCIFCVCDRILGVYIEDKCQIHQIFIGIIDCPALILLIWETPVVYRRLDSKKK